MCVLFTCASCKWWSRPIYVCRVYISLLGVYCSRVHVCCFVLCVCVGGGGLRVAVVGELFMCVLCVYVLCVYCCGVCVRVSVIQQPYTKQTLLTVRLL